MTAPAEDPPADHDLLRLPLPPRDFVPSGWRPTSAEFEPSTAEKRAESDGRRVRISVWDATLTSIVQARTFRGRECLVLCGRAANVREQAFGVVYERLDPALRDEPGASGHAAIVGVGRLPNETKVAWRDRLQRLADEFVLIEQAS